MLLFFPSSILLSIPFFLIVPLAPSFSNYSLPSPLSYRLRKLTKRVAAHFIDQCELISISSPSSAFPKPSEAYNRDFGYYQTAYTCPPTTPTITRPAAAVVVHATLHPRICPATNTTTTPATLPPSLTRTRPGSNPPYQCQQQ
jgi:hypothetical protein